MSLTFELPAHGVLQPNDAHDPLPYYYHPWVGWLYRHRLQMGLDLLPPGGTRVLEVGVGSGVLVPTLTKRFAEYTGTDLTLAPGLLSLVAPGCQARFVSADLTNDGDLPAGHFDAIVCFSVLEHIADADGAARGLALMTRAFELIGYRGIDDHHVTPPARIASALARVLRPAGRSAFPPFAPVTAALYQCTAWRQG